MGIFEQFKTSVNEIRKKTEEFKNDHKMASAAISKTIDAMPSPFNQFGKIVWEGLEKEDESTEKLLEILNKIEKNNEESFWDIKNQIQFWMESNASHQDTQEISEQIRTSHESIKTILETGLGKIQNQLKKVSSHQVEISQDFKSRKESEENKKRQGNIELLQSLQPLQNLIGTLTEGIKSPSQVPMDEFRGMKNSHLDSLERVVNQYSEVIDHSVFSLINQFIFHAKDFPTSYDQNNYKTGMGLIQNISSIIKVISKDLNFDLTNS